jgi:hypothetical protein
MSVITNLAAPERFRMVADRVRANIDAELLDMEFVLRPTWDGEGFDVVGSFACLWRRDYFRGAQDVPSWGTHTGCIRRKRDGKLTAEIHNGHYDMGEESAKSDFFARQVGLG